jgi:5-methylthioadenosine/S-adenosylhomocysteine deaminase
VTANRTAYFAKWVVPISSPPIRDGWVVVEGSRIIYVGNGDGRPEVSRTVLNGGIMIPGLVNAHTHLELTVLRGLLEGMNFREWLRVLTEVRSTVLDDAALLDSSVIGIHEGLLAGITTYADTTASGLPLAAMRAMGVRGIGYLEVFGPADHMADQSMAGLEARVHASRQEDTALVQTGVSPHAPYTVSAELFGRVARFAREEQLPVAVHVAESAAEVALVQKGEGPFADGLRARGIAVHARNQSPIQFLAETGILDDTRALLIHCVRIDENDARIIAERGCTIVHCPVSNAKLGHGIAPLHRMLQAGILTGLGSDSVASNNRMDLLTEARLATLFQSVERALPDALSATDALRLATLGGAQALGLEARVGTLEAGKDADITIFPLDRIEALTGFDPADMLVHALAGAVLPRTVLVAGVERVRDGQVIHADGLLAARVAHTGERLAQWRR